MTTTAPPISASAPTPRLISAISLSTSPGYRPIACAVPLIVSA